MPAQSTGGRNGGGRGKYKQANKQLSENVSVSRLRYFACGGIEYIR